MLPYNQDNIVAIATPPGVGALAIVRLSGKNLKSLYKDFTRSSPKNRYAHFSRIYHPKKNILLDEAIVIYFKSPNSFTGEDMIEISCHGGEAVKRSLVRAAVDCGVRIADPGEFSFRSFLNGKMDLLQAEAVSALISSKTALPAEISLHHLAGKVSSMLFEIKSQIVDLLSIIENELNFSEEEIISTSSTEIKSNILNVQSKIVDLLDSSLFGKNIFSGIRVIIYGKPNAGKSSLFNALLGNDRAITSSFPGTTRDSVESWFELEGVPVCLVDTAGVWGASDGVDALGVEKTMSELSLADICLLVDEKDPSSLINEHFKKIYKHHYIMVRSKSDLFPEISNGSIGFSVSSLKNTGINKLLTELSTYIVSNYSQTSGRNVLITERQRSLLASSNKFLIQAIKQVDSDVSVDIVASTLRGFILSIKEVVGEIPDKEILQNIFNNFCVGK